MGTHTKILIGIVVGIALGAILGGAFPAAGLRVELLGEIFLNLLMMLVVPLVIFSMIVGVTGLGDIRHVGSLGGRTVAYYFCTTAIAVSLGILAVNVIRPGVGVAPGERHPDAAYTVGGADGRTVTLADGQWVRSSYGSQFVLVLEDQRVQGRIVEMTPASATVDLWARPAADTDVVYLRAEDGTRLPFRRIDGRLVSQEPTVDAAGTGVRIALPGRVAGEAGERTLGGTLREVLLGNEETGAQGLIPRNLFRAMAQMEILPLIVFALLFGAALSVLGETGAPAVRVFSALNDGIMRLVHWVILLAPVGIFGLVAGRLARAGGFSGFGPELLALGKYALTVGVGLALHAFVVLPLALRVLGRRRPLAYARGVGAALLNALSTASSSATLPLTMQGVEEENGVSNRSASFVLPLGATINMDGTALYESVAAIFIAQVYGITLGPGEQLVVFLTATLAAVGAAGIPEAGLVTMVIVLAAVGLPIEGVGLILTIDWLLDRFRTTVNVWGDSVGAAIIDRFEQKQPAPAGAG